MSGNGQKDKDYEREDIERRLEEELGWKLEIAKEI